MVETQDRILDILSRASCVIASESEYFACGPGAAGPAAA
jgi:hypothetical protein